MANAGAAQEAQQPAHWSKQSLNSRPNDVFGSPLEMTNLREASLGFTDPIHAYPMFEQALRIRHGRTLEQQMAVASGIWERFSSVAVRNPYAAIPRFHTASEMCRVGPANRLVGYPYTKLMNSNNSVDQAAALILCSAGKARSLGIPKDLWVFLTAPEKVRTYNSYPIASPWQNHRRLLLPDAPRFNCPGLVLTMFHSSISIPVFPRQFR